MTPTEEIVSEILKQREIILEAVEKQGELLKRLVNRNSEDSDWVTVKTAAANLGTSISLVYKLINTGRLQKVRHIGSKKYVSWNEISSIDDKIRL